MTPELIAILVTAFLQTAMLVAVIVMLYKNFAQISENFRQSNAYDAATFRRVEEILREMRESLRK